MATKKKMLQAAAGVSTGPEGAWDLSYAYYNDPSLGSVLNSPRLAGFSVNAQEALPTGVSFKLDGTKMYVIGTNGDDVNEYNLSTAWSVSTASYSQNFSISAQETAPQDVTFKTDGTKMYVLGYTGKDVNEYSLSTAWDVSTASYTQNFSVSSQGDYPYGIFFKPDGTKMYVIDIISGKLSEYTLSTGWDVSSASLAQQFTYRNLSTQLYQGTAVAFSQDGISMYILCRSDYQTGVKGVYRFTLSTAWDISTAVLGEVGPTVTSTDPLGMFLNPDLSRYYVIGDGDDTVSEYSMGGFSVAAKEGSPNGLYFKPEGDKMYISGTSSDSVHEYDLGQIPPLNVAAQDTSPTGFFFKPDGSKLYVVGVTGRDVNEYNLSTAWDATSATFSQLFSISAQDTSPWGIFFKPDGTKMYVLGVAGRDVIQYNLSTAWDISTASYSQNFSVATQETGPTGISFKPDGTKMFVTGYSSDSVNEYSLSTAWDVSTASFSQAFSVATQETMPTGLFFKDDGTKMYVLGFTGDDVNEYNLSTAWDVSSASFSQLFNVRPQGDNPAGLFFKPDGTKMYVCVRDLQIINEYNLSTAWDVSAAAPAVDPETYFNTSTAIFVQSFSVSAQDINPYGIFFKPDGTKMYMLGISGADLNEYNLSTAWDISTASYSQSFSYDSGDVNARGIFFKPDGTKMYIVGMSYDRISEYNLSTAWDISTASYLQSFLTTSEQITPQSVFFKPDGKKMFVVGRGDPGVNEYDLSADWDVSTASHVQDFSILAQGSFQSAMYFKEDGTKMLIANLSGDRILTYSLGVQE